VPIAVSKLCCPLCHLAFTAFEHTHPSQAPFSVRGRHSTVYAVDFPRCLPQKVQEDLLQRLRLLVLKELEFLLAKYYTTQLQPGSSAFEQDIPLDRTLSQESGSAMSTASQGAFSFGTWEAYIPSLFWH
jgi:hypothetical protein